MADIRIKDLATTATTTASDDFMAVDGVTNGTRKLSAATPAFLTSVTTPTLTSPASTNLTLGTGSFGTALTVASATGDVSIASTTAGSSGAGALVVTGGLATGAASYIGGNLTAAGAITALGLTVSSTGSTQPVIDGGSSSGFPILEIKNSGAGGQRWLIENGRTAQSLGFYNATQTGSVLLLGPTGNVTVPGTGTHTFGTTNTVTMAAGVLTTTGAATFAGAVAIGNSTAASVAAPSTHKVSILIGGVQYYLLASNV